MRAPPPSSALRSEDAQPNENEVRTKPWEISAPPSIGMSKSKRNALPSNVPTGPRSPQQRPPSLPQKPRPYHPNIARPQPQRPPAEAPKAPKAPLSKKQRQKLRQEQNQHQQQQQHARKRDKQPTSQPPPKKPRLDSTPSTSHLPGAPSADAAAIRNQLEQSRSIKVDDIYPDIRLWPQQLRIELARIIANANLSDAPASSIATIRNQFAGTKAQEIQNARSYAGTCLNKHRNYSDILCLALRNRPRSLLALLRIRVDLYRCIPAVTPALPKHPVPNDRRYAANLVKRVRNVCIELLGLKLVDIDASAFCAAEQMLRPLEPVELESADQLRDTTDIGHHALAVLENYIKIFGPRIFDLTSSDVEQWKRRTLPHDMIENLTRHRQDSSAVVDANLDAQQVNTPQTVSQQNGSPSIGLGLTVVPLQNTAELCSGRTYADLNRFAGDQKESTEPSDPKRPEDAYHKSPLHQDTLREKKEYVAGIAADSSAGKGSVERSAQDADAADKEMTIVEDVHTPPPSPPRFAQSALQPNLPPSPAVVKGHGLPSQDRPVAVSKSPARSPSISPKLAQLSSVLSIVERTSAASPDPGRQPSHEDILEEARQAEELARFLEQSSDTEIGSSATTAPHVVSARLIQAVKDKSSALQPDQISIKAEKLGEADKKGTDEEDEDDRPLAEALGLRTLARHPSSTDSDPEEDMPLRDLLRRQSSATPSIRSVRGWTETHSTWPSMPFEPTVLGLKQHGAFSAVPGLSIKYFVPVASTALDAITSVRSRASVFDAAVAVSEYGRIATFAPEQMTSSNDRDAGLPRRLMQCQARDKADKNACAIDRVEDASRLTSKVCGIASSTRRLLGLGNHDDYPSQVSLVTVDDTGRAHRTYHLEERPHVQGAASISHFPRTDPDNASSIDFATGGIDGIVNHWRWKARSTGAETFRLHTLHDSKPVVALEHLSSRSNILASASVGTIIGYDLAALTLGFSWNTSDHIVHLQRTPDPKLMLGVLARRDYDQFRMFDITGRNGPISRPVISFGWLNDAEGKLPLGRGTFHPSRRAIFAHGAEDGHVRVWDMRNARDPLIDQRLGDEPIVQTIWASSADGDDEDIMYVSTTKGVRSISLLAS